MLIPDHVFLYFVRLEVAEVASSSKVGHVGRESPEWDEANFEETNTSRAGSKDASRNVSRSSSKPGSGVSSRNVSRRASRAGSRSGSVVRETHMQPTGKTLQVRS